MAFQNRLENVSLIASTDLHQHYFVELSTTQHKVTIASSGNGFGVIQNSPLAGEHATVSIRGAAKVHAGATVTAGQFITSAASGFALGAAEYPTNTGSAGTFITELAILGQALTDAASGSVFTMELSPRFTQVVSA